LLKPNLDRELKTGTQKRRLKSDETDPTGKTEAEAETEAGTTETTDEVADSLKDEILEVVIGAMTDEVVMIEEAVDEMIGEEEEELPGEAQVLTEGATEVQVHTEGDKKTVEKFEMRRFSEKTKLKNIQKMSR